MSNGKDKLDGLSAQTSVKPRLVIVKAEPTPDASASDEATPPRPKSNLARFMTAYADAIDRDIKLLLDL